MPLSHLYLLKCCYIKQASNRCEYMYDVEQQRQCHMHGAWNETATTLNMQRDTAALFLEFVYQ